VTAYATYAQFMTFFGRTLPGTTSQANVERMLLRASELMDDTVVAPFAVSSVTTLPTDADVDAAMRDATSAQVEFWLETGEGGDIDGLAGTQVTVAGYTGTRPGVRAPRALRILRNAGLMVPS